MCILTASSIWWAVCAVSSSDISICSQWNHSSLASLNSCENSPCINHSLGAHVQDQLPMPAPEPKACAAVQPLHPQGTQAVRARNPLLCLGQLRDTGVEKGERVMFEIFFDDYIFHKKILCFKMWRDGKRNTFLIPSSLKAMGKTYWV